MSHPLHPLPQRLARLLIQSKDKQLAAKVDGYLARNTPYKRVHEWLDAEDNVPLRQAVGQHVCAVIESENTAALEE